MNQGLDNSFKSGYNVKKTLDNSKNNSNFDSEHDYPNGIIPSIVSNLFIFIGIIAIFSIFGSNPDIAFLLRTKWHHILLSIFAVSLSFDLLWLIGRQDFMISFRFGTSKLINSVKINKLKKKIKIPTYIDDDTLSSLSEFELYIKKRKPFTKRIFTINILFHLISFLIISIISIILSSI